VDPDPPTQLKKKNKEISRFEEHDFKPGVLGAPTGAWLVP